MRINNKILVAVLCSFTILLVFVCYLAVDTYLPVAQDDTPVVNQSSHDITVPPTSQQIIVQPPVENTTESVVENEITTQSTPNVTSVSDMTDQQLLDVLTAAINKTRGYKDNVTVNHTESFEANILECSGGSVVKSVANTIVGMVTKPVDEVLSFSGGKATDSKDVVIPILLPQFDAFTLKLNGVKSISGSMNGSVTVIKVELVREVVDLFTVPEVNASALGYLDINTYDTSILEVGEATIDYTGSTLEIHIRPDGYVSYAKYKMPMIVDGSATGAGISGSAVFEGYQAEEWQFNW